ncbi:NLRC3 [Symbiodinium natans]|uniref:NLRC3 protein n=1 Tax=Symbiodinium natans TaxID=878477 RepID=A0A812SAA4_9DINO|nr:NLRC3 [Symbiodinium natans]
MLRASGYQSQTCLKPVSSPQHVSGNRGSGSNSVCRKLYHTIAVWPHRLATTFGWDPAGLQDVSSLWSYDYGDYGLPFKIIDRRQVNPGRMVYEEHGTVYLKSVRVGKQIGGRQQLEKWQKWGRAPLPVVRLCFVGRGRAGKTTTMRRLRGEQPSHEEVSTHGVHVWAGQAQEHLSHKWKECDARMYDETARRELRRRRRSAAASSTDKQEALVERQPAPESPEMPPKESEPADAPAGATAKTSQRDAELKEEAPETVGPRILDDLALQSRGEGEDADPALRPRLQCWDFPGQQAYVLCNLLYFHGRGIYVVFCDTSCGLEEAWQDLKFWLWAVAQYAVDADDGYGGLASKSSQSSESAPPVVIVGTKWASRHPDFDEEKMEERIDLLLQQLPRLSRQLQRVGDNLGWLHPVENFSENAEADIGPLRSSLQRLASEVLSPIPEWERTAPAGSATPAHVGLQAELHPAAWLLAHDLLSELGESFDLKVDPNDLDASLSHPRQVGVEGSAVLSKDLQGTHAVLGHRFVAPESAHVSWKSGHHDDEDGLMIVVRVQCHSLRLEQVEALLGGMRPIGISKEEVPGVLRLLHSLGTLFWFDTDELGRCVVLNIRRVAVALSSIMSLRFWEESGLEHAEEYKNTIDDVSRSMTQAVYRFKTSGIITWDLLKRLWAGEGITDLERKVMLEIMVSRGLVLRRLVQDEFTVPCCLPTALMPEPRAAESKIVYLDVAGFISSNLFPEIAGRLCRLRAATVRNRNSSEGQTTLRPGAPQIFRNRMEFRTDKDALVSISLFPTTPRIQHKLLRLAVTQAGARSAEELQADMTVRDIVEDLCRAMGLCSKSVHVLGTEALTQHPVFRGVDCDRIKDVEAFVRRTPCLQADCNATCAHCKLAELLEERFDGDFSQGLRDAIDRSSLQRLTRPAGSFRFQQVLHPCDVDLEEYVVVSTVSMQATDLKEMGETPKGAAGAAIRELMKLLQDLCEGASTASSQTTLHVVALKAGKNPAKPGESLSWSVKEVMAGEKRCLQSAEPVKLEDALQQQGGRTAKIDFYVKCGLLERSMEDAPRFYELTNVIRCGYDPGNSLVHPVTPEVDFLHVVEKGMREYSGPHPKAMKLAALLHSAHDDAKRLWEHSAYLAQRSIDGEKHLAVLQALKPIFGGWPAQLAQVAAHAETLRDMLSRTSLQTEALNDIPFLSESLRRLQVQLKLEGPGREAAMDGSACIEDVLTRLQQFREGSQDVTSLPASVWEAVLEQVHDVLEGCVELAVVNWLGSSQNFKHPIVEPLRALWDFPSDHPPVGAQVAMKMKARSGQELPSKSLSVCSWNVLNRHYMKFINEDLQGLKGSRLQQISAEQRAQEIVDAVMEMLCHESHPKAVLCLQECWSELLDLLEKELLAVGFDMQCTSADRSQKNQEAIIFDKSLLELRDFRCCPYASDPKKVVAVALFRWLGEAGDDGQFRVITTHLPGRPNGPARREFCDCLAGLVKEDCCSVPTLLAGDLNFPEEAIGPLLRRTGQLTEVHFAAIPYPTNICDASWLPKRIDNIASLSPAGLLEVRALEADEVLSGLQRVVDLLRYRCLGLDLPPGPGTPGPAAKLRGSRVAHRSQVVAARARIQQQAEELAATKAESKRLMQGAAEELAAAKAEIARLKMGGAEAGDVRGTAGSGDRVLGGWMRLAALRDMQQQTTREEEETLSLSPQNS